jgi:hypothetical protein
MREVEMSPVQGFLVRKSPSGDAILRFEEDGNVVVAGTLYTGASVANLTPTSQHEFLVRNAAGQVVARASAQTGDLYIKGSKSENQSSLTSSPSVQELVIRSSTGQVQSLIDENGNLKMRGKVL